jgi:colicin import membrane protein
MESTSDRWVSITLSVLLHGALLAALVYGWLLFRKPTRPTPTLAIEAQVVDARAVRGALQPPQPKPPPPAPPQEVEPLPPQQQPQESAGPPQPTPEELAQREQARQQAEAAATQKAADDKAAADKAAADAARQAQVQRKTEEQRKTRQAADAKRAAEEQRKADAREAHEREAELQQSLAAEAQADKAARAGPALANWESQIAAKITRAWIRPPTARVGIECTLHVTQVPGGEVTQVTIGECNGDAAVRESIATAAYRASPLPPPPDPSLFERNLNIDFKPD